MQRAEYAAMFGPEPQKFGFIPANFEKLRANPAMIIDGDYDVFGDGSVVIKAAPGHTPGHQVLVVRLPKTGPVMLSGDMVHLQYSWNYRVVPSFNFDVQQSMRTIDEMKAFARRPARSSGSTTTWSSTPRSRRRRNRFMSAMNEAIIVLILGTATPGGGFPLYGAAFAEMVNAQEPRVRIEPRNTKGIDRERAAARGGQARPRAGRRRDRQRRARQAGHAAAHRRRDVLLARHVHRSRRQPASRDLRPARQDRGDGHAGFGRHRARTNGSGKPSMSR